MKKQILILACLVITTLSLHAQAPEKMNYQGIARSTNGLPMQFRNLGLRISILDGATAVYVETNNISTNGFGLYKLAIGEGTPTTGSMGSIDWSSGNKFVKVEIDPNGGTNYTTLGTNELLSVPYALYAASSGGSADSNPTGPAGGDLTGTYPDPEIADDVVTTSKLADNSITSSKVEDGAIGTDKLSNGAVTSNKIDDMGAMDGQVLKFDGTNWIPGTDEGGTGSTYTAGDGIDISGANVISADLGTDIETNELQDAAVTTPKIADNAITSTKLDAMGATNGQFLKFDGTNWVPDNVTGGTGDNWGSQVAETDASIDGDGTATNPLSLADAAVTSEKLDAMGATNGQFLKFDGTNWVPDNVTGGTGDNWGSQVTETTDRLNGDGTSGNPLDIAQQGANNGQVLKWNGSTWEPADDEIGTGGGSGDDWGNQVVEADATLDGEGTVADPLGVADNAITSNKLANNAVTSEKLDQMGASNNQVLKWNGTEWIPADDETGTGGGTGDDWGSQVAETDATLDGDGTTANPLSLADAAVTSEKIHAMGATNGQVLKFDGTNWVPGTDDGGGAGTTYTAGDGITISPADEISADLGTDIETSELQDAAVTEIKVADDAITTDKIIDGAITSPKIDAMGATNGQVLKFDGTNWVPQNEATGSNPGWALDGNNATASDFIGTTNSEPLRFKQNNNYAGSINGGSTSLGVNSLPESSTGIWNTGFGLSTLTQNTTGERNTAIGAGALGDNTTGDSNSAVGEGALSYNENGFNNSAFGAVSLLFNTSGKYNTSIGAFSMNHNTVGNSNTAVGEGSLLLHVDGDFNTAMGKGALKSNISGDRNTAIGNLADVSTGNLTNATAIGANAFVAQDNSMVLGSINGVNNATADTKVGIGTTSPDVQLDISGGQWDLTNTEGDLRIGNDTHRLKMSIATGGVGAGNGRIRAVGGTNKLLLGSGTVDVLTISGNGHIGINNENPDEELVIGDNIGSGYVVPAATIGNSSGGAIKVGNSTTNLSIDSGSAFNRGRIIARDDANGYGKGNIEMRTRQLSVGIDAGVDLVNAYPLRIIQSAGYGMYLENATDATNNWEAYASNSGNLYLFSGVFQVGTFDGVSGNYSSTSDRRLKTNITNMPSISEKLLQLQAKNYNYKTNLDKKYNGFLAQDIQKLFPEIISENEGRNSGDFSVLTVDYAQLTVLAVKAIQEQQEIIEEQAKELTAMHKLLGRLEARMDKMEKQ